MRRMGIAEDVAMRISGHRTREIFRRYRIIADDDLRDAAAIMDAHVASRTVPLSVPPTSGVDTTNYLS